MSTFPVGMKRRDPSMGHARRQKKVAWKKGRKEERILGKEGKMPRKEQRKGRVLVLPRMARNFEGRDE